MKKYIFELLILITCIISSSSNASADIMCQNDKKHEKQEKVKRIIVSGIVTNEQGNRLDRVIIVPVRIPEETESVAFLTTNGGKFSLYIDNNRTLVFSLNGYESTRVNINGKEEIDVILRKVSNK